MLRPTLEKVQDVTNHVFEAPTKKIHDGPDVSFFLQSLAYRDIMTFVLQLNRSMISRKTDGNVTRTYETWHIRGGNIILSDSVRKLQQLIQTLKTVVTQVPPDEGPRRFGNVSFRTWYNLAKDQSTGLLQSILPEDLHPCIQETQSYLLGSFGSPQRLDYGTGHELSFLAFLGCLWRIGFFPAAEPGVVERTIVLGVFEPYLELVRILIKSYTLEPAGSHGVWGLDDNSFLPYLFGSAQLSPAIAETDETPLQGSLPDAPEPDSVAKANLVNKEKSHNMYFSAIAFILDVKTGPFWEHSPMLYDISGIKDGWGKINKGMIKMYNAEVLSKFPVVQHFPFGSLFKWEKDPEAKVPPPSTHTSNQPMQRTSAAQIPPTTRAGRLPTTAAPWTARPAPPPIGFVNGGTQAPWASRTPAPPQATFRVPSGRPQPPFGARQGPNVSKSDRGG